MKKTLLFISFSFSCILSFAQNEDQRSPLIDKVTGNIYASQYVDVQGSQFLYDNWLNGMMELKNGVVFNNLQLKFDNYSNKFIANKGDKGYEITSDIHKVWIYPEISDTLFFENGFQINSKINAGKFLQVLAEGKITLLKFANKELETYNEYGNANILKRFRETPEYYIYKNGQYETVKLSKKDLEDKLSDKWPAVSAYLSKSGVSGKDEKGWAKAFQYYNALSPGN